MMDAETVQLLQELPDDLRERGWCLSVSESRALKGESPRFAAVYSRPVDGRLDLENFHLATYDKRTRQQVVRISTLKDASSSWHDAQQDGIRRMRAADAKRRRKR